MLDLQGNVAVVAGSEFVAEDRGNGRATAVLMARQGAKVSGTDVNADALNGTTEIMDKEGRAQLTRRGDGNSSQSG